MPQFTHYLPTPQLTLLIVTNAHMHFKKIQWHLSLLIFFLFLPPLALLSSHEVKLDAVIKLSGASPFLSGFGVSLFLVPLELDRTDSSVGPVRLSPTSAALRLHF